MSVLVPSRSESFGLVALEAAACGTPVVAAGVGGLLTLVDHGHTGFLVPGRDPEVFASYTDEILGNERLGGGDGTGGGAALAAYTWSLAAARCAGVYGDLTVGARVECGERAVRRRRRWRSLERQVDGWLHRMADANPVVSGVGRDEDAPTTLVRAHAGRGARRSRRSGSPWASRTIRYETYVMPAPEENQGSSTSSCCAATSASSAPTSRSGSRTPSSCGASSRWRPLDEDELDRVVGSLYAYVEQVFPAAIRLGFASRF